MRTGVLVVAVLGGLLIPGAATHASCRCRPVADYGPVWSRDDTAIAYTEAYEAAHVVSLTTGADTAGATPSPTVVYSPDWRSAAAIVNEPASGYSLIVFRPDGSAVRRLDGAFPTSPTWSPDGEHLAYIGADEGLYVIGVGGSGRHRVAARVYPYAAASWSPEGSQLAFVAGKDVFVAPVAGGAARNVTEGIDGTHLDPAWSPRGDLLAVVTDVGARFDVVGVDGIRRLEVGSQLPVAYAGISFSWSPRGDKLLYSHRFNPAPYSPGVYEIDISTGTQRRVSPFGIEASYSHDGSRIAFGGTVTIEPNPPNTIDCVGVGIWTVPSGGGTPTLVARTCTETPPTLSIHAPATVDYGKPASLSGGALPGFGAVVDIAVRPCGRRASSRIAVADGGAWSQTIAPSVTTEYAARSATEEVQTTVPVRPVVLLRQASKLRFDVRVRADRTFAGRVVNVELANNRTGKMALLRRVALRTLSRSDSTVVSGTRFRLAARELHPWLESLSVVLPKRATGACLEPAVSDAIPVSRP